jgi:hypothetical protein
MVFIVTHQIIFIHPSSLLLNMKSLNQLAATVLLLMLGHTLLSQTVTLNRSLWTRLNESQITVNAADRQIIPEAYLAYRLDVAQLRQLLSNAPSEADVLNNDATPLLMEFPTPTGGFMLYRVSGFTMMHPQLQAQFPEIRTFLGTCVDPAGGVVFFDFTPQGFHSMTLRSEQGSVFIDPYSKADDQHYVVYYKKNFVRKESDRMVCHVTEDFPVQIKVSEMNNAEFPIANCTKRREYRLAVAATGEYTAFHSLPSAPNVAAGQAAIVTAMNRVNGVYITEVSVQMNLVANNSTVVYTNGATDPYSNGDGVAMLAQNQTNLDAVILTANYDIGHVFSTGGGGVASTAPCSSTSKAYGVTGLGAPIGDPFYIDYVAHEMGHQYSASHTFSSVVGSCSGNGVASSAFEPGSGTTIMAYAGICGVANVQSNSDAYFHARSLLQISNAVIAHTCDNEIANGNTAPSVAAFTSITIPTSTPFVLNGSATDPSPLTYCWEQYNNAQVSPPNGSNTSGPLFRSLTPVSETNRHFPSFDNTFGGTVDPWEVLPAVARTLTFRLTARDNVAVGGCSDEKDITVTVSAGGPFSITAPNSGALAGNSTTTVTWNTASSATYAPNVDILYSTTPSNPSSYILILTNTPNDGTQAITVPNLATSTARIMVRSASTNGTFFYDISDSNLSISLPVELVGFNAEKQKNQVLLQWETASEQDNRGFHVQRSVNSSRYFENIGFVAATSELKAKNLYNFTDKDVKPGNIYYYRLQQEDQDGDSNLSDIRSVNFEGVTGQLQITPNPARDYVQLTASEMDWEDVFEITIINAAGQVIRQTTMSLDNALSTVDWPAGVYLIRAVSENKIWAGKVVK